MSSPTIVSPTLSNVQSPRSQRDRSDSLIQELSEKLEERGQAEPHVPSENLDIYVNAKPVKSNTLKAQPSEKTFDFDLSSDSETEANWRKSQNDATNAKRQSVNLFGRSFNALDDDDSFTYD